MRLVCDIRGKIRTPSLYHPLTLFKEEVRLETHGVEGSVSGVKRNERSESFTSLTCRSEVFPSFSELREVLSLHPLKRG
jgi:hypothetical protein